MASTRNLAHDLGPASDPASFSMTLDHWLVIGPIAAALAMAAMLIWMAGAG